jgi:hypothetical protein
MIAFDWTHRSSGQQRHTQSYMVLLGSGHVGLSKHLLPLRTPAADPRPPLDTLIFVCSVESQLSKAKQF